MAYTSDNPFKDCFTMDLGTTNSAVTVIMNNEVVSVEDQTGAFTFPSIVAYSFSGKIVGYSAKKMIDQQKCPVVTNAKRVIGQYKSNESNVDASLFGVPLEWVGDFPKFVIGDDHVNPTDVSSEVIRYGKSLAEKKTGETMRNIVITVPAYFSEDQKRATREAAKQVGLNVLSLLEEPVAASLEYSLKAKTGIRKVLVFDFGGGTFDVTIVQIDNNDYHVLSTGGENNLGGSDVDVKIAVNVMNMYYEKTGENLIDMDGSVSSTKLFNKLKKTCESAKINLSATDRTVISLLPFIPDDDEDDEDDDDDDDDDFSSITITASQLKDWVEEFMIQCRKKVEECLSDAHLTTRDITDVIMVGGSSYLKSVKDMLEGIFGDRVYRDPHPEQSVSRGAAIFLMNSKTQEKKITTKTTYDVCFEMGNGRLAMIIPRGIDIPTTGAKTFTTMADYQSTLTTSLVQRNGDGSLQKLRPIKLMGVPLLPMHIPRLYVVVNITNEGVFRIECNETTKQVPIKVVMDEVVLK